MAKFVTVESYLEHLPGAVQGLARALRDTIRGVNPALVEAIRYDMPAFRYGEVTVLYFAVWKNHIGLYPIYRGTEAFEAALAPWRAKTDTVHFPLNRPLPLDLVADIVRSQLARAGLQA